MPQVGFRSKMAAQRKRPKNIGSGKLSRKRQIEYKNKARALREKGLL